MHAPRCAARKTAGIQVAKILVDQDAPTKLVDQEAARKKEEAFTEGENQVPEEQIKAAAQAATAAEIVGAADATAAAAGLCTVS